MNDNKQLWEFLRYGAASAVALIADAGSLYVLTSVFGLPYLYSGAVAFLLGLGVVYALSVLWVFERRTTNNTYVEFLLFALIGVVGLGINEGILWLLTGVFGLYYLLSKAASVAVVFCWNFLARKYILFRT